MLGYYLPTYACNPCSLTKDVEIRPGFQELLGHAFIRKMEEETREVKTWYADVLAKEKAAA